MSEVDLRIFDPAQPAGGAFRPLKTDDLRPAAGSIVGGVLSGGGLLVPPDGRPWTAFYLFNADDTADAIFTVTSLDGSFDVVLAAGGEYDEKGEHRAVVVASSGPVVWRGTR